MSYTALYRKFRPQDFEDVKGQDHIVTALRNQIETKRVSHAYLFTGTRGTGNTTMARILARAVNCEHPVNGNPCNECPTCKAILEDHDLDVIELNVPHGEAIGALAVCRHAIRHMTPVEGKRPIKVERSAFGCGLRGRLNRTHVYMLGGSIDRVAREIFVFHA